MRYLIISALAASLGLGQQLPQQLAQMDTRMAEIAIDTARAGALTPVPLMVDGPREIGAVYDQFLTGVALAKSAIAAGTPVDPSLITADPAWRSRAVTVVAYPTTCEGKPNQPRAIRVSASGAPVAPEPIGEPASGSAAAGRIPGVTFPENALVASFRNVLLFNARFEIDYDNPVCHGGAKTAVAATAMSPSRELMTTFNGVKLPADLAGTIASPSTVRMRVILDPSGHARVLEQLQGPPELGPVATAALKDRTFAPARMNGVPMPLTILVPFVFTANGAPAPAAPYNPQTGVTIAGNTMSVSRTVAVPMASAAPGSTPSLDVPGLNASTSRCAVADDDYGFTMEQAIKTGGGAMLGPAREQKYLGALRGPNGEGLRWMRRGSTLARDSTILDVYEITYTGLAQPIRIYLDEYHDELLKAPKGLVCASVLDIK